MFVDCCLCVVIRVMLFGVCLSFVSCRLLWLVVVCWLLLDVCCLLLDVANWLFDVYCLLLLLLVVGCSLFVGRCHCLVCCSLFVARCSLFAVQ